MSTLSRSLVIIAAALLTFGAATAITMFVLSADEMTPIAGDPLPAVDETAPVDAEVPAPPPQPEARAPQPPVDRPTPTRPEPMFDCREVSGTEVCDTFDEADEGPGTR